MADANHWSTWQHCIRLERTNQESGSWDCWSFCSCCLKQGRYPVNSSFFLAVVASNIHLVCCLYRIILILDNDICYQCYVTFMHCIRTHYFFWFSEAHMFCFMSLQPGHWKVQIWGGQLPSVSPWRTGTSSWLWDQASWGHTKTIMGGYNGDIIWYDMSLSIQN